MKRTGMICQERRNYGRLGGKSTLLSVLITAVVQSNVVMMSYSSQQLNLNSYGFSLEKSANQARRFVVCSCVQLGHRTCLRLYALGAVTVAVVGHIFPPRESKFVTRTINNPPASLRGGTSVWRETRSERMYVL